MLPRYSSVSVSYLNNADAALYVGLVLVYYFALAEPPTVALRGRDLSVCVSRPL